MKHAGGFFILVKNRRYITLEKILSRYGVGLAITENRAITSHGNNAFIFLVAGEGFKPEELKTKTVIHEDHLIRDPEKVAAIVLSKLKLNRIIFARNCEVKRIQKKAAEDFLDSYHLMNSTASAFNYGLFCKDELVAVASFSKGRKMNRLPGDQRSFELIRFCSKAGITVAGGLTKLVKNFCNDKKAGDIMTYVDKQLSDGSSFVRAGFKKHSETEPNFFLVERATFERIPSVKKESFDPERFYRSQTAGNIKLIYTPG